MYISRQINSSVLKVACSDRTCAPFGLILRGTRLLLKCRRGLKQPSSPAPALDRIPLLSRADHLFTQHS
jgi:hypothetical protein